MYSYGIHLPALVVLIVVGALVVVGSAVVLGTAVVVVVVVVVVLEISTESVSIKRESESVSTCLLQYSLTIVSVCVFS